IRRDLKVVVDAAQTNVAPPSVRRPLQLDRVGEDADADRRVRAREDADFQSPGVDGNRGRGCLRQGVAVYPLAATGRTHPDSERYGSRQHRLDAERGTHAGRWGW